jgi:hypothetical protein
VLAAPEFEDDEAVPGGHDAVDCLLEEREPHIADKRERRRRRLPEEREPPQSRSHGDEGGIMLAEVAYGKRRYELAAGTRSLQAAADEVGLT